MESFWITYDQLFNNAASFIVAVTVIVAGMGGLFFIAWDMIKTFKDW